MSKYKLDSITGCKNICNENEFLFNKRPNLIEPVTNTADDRNVEIKHLMKPSILPKKPIDLPKKSYVMSKKPIEMPKKPIEMPKKPMDLPKKSYVIPKKTIEMPKKPIVMPKKPIDMPKLYKPLKQNYSNKFNRYTKPQNDAPVINFYIEIIDPPLGPKFGGNNVIITGNDLALTKYINFAELKITSFNFIDNKHIMITVPAMSEEKIIQITVVRGIPSSQSTLVSNPITYTYATSPSIIDISPNTGEIDGNIIVTITGEHLDNVQSIQFGDEEITSYYNINDKAIGVVVPKFNNNINVNVTVKTYWSISNALIYTYLLPAIFEKTNDDVSIMDQ